MPSRMNDSRAPRDAGSRAGETVLRWECACQQPPVLLGTYEPRGPINLKVRDRYWHIVGTAWTVCPKCGAEHVLTVPVEAAGDEERT